MRNLHKCLKRVNEHKLTKHAHHWLYVAYYLYALAEGSGIHQALVGGVLAVNVLIAVSGD